MFKREDLEKPYYVTLKIQDHYTFKELIAHALDKFNDRLAQSDVNGKYRLEANPDKFE